MVEEGYVKCPRCNGKGYIVLGWKFMEGTTDDIRIPSDEKERCEACKDSKYPGYVFMPPAIHPDGHPEYCDYYLENRNRYY